MDNQGSEEFVTSTISVAIPEFNEQYVNGKTVTFYSINVTNHYSKTNWSLVKRFSEFVSSGLLLITVGSLRSSFTFFS